MSASMGSRVGVLPDVLADVTDPFGQASEEWALEIDKSSIIA